MFENKPKPKPKPIGFGSDGVEEPEEASGLDDDDFSVLKAAAPVESSRDNSEQRGLPNGRSKRAAAAAPKKWVIDDDEESESDDDKLLGDVGAMVKGIGGGDKTDATTANGRLSLFAMSRPGSSHGRATSNDLPKLKAKPSRQNFDLSDDNDETNYEMLARSSPHKAPPVFKENLDSFLSDDEELVPIPKKAPAKAAVPKVAAKPAPKPKKAPAPKKAAPEPKPAALSPAAKAYAAKQNKMKLSKDVFSDDEDEEDVEMDDSPPPKPAARGRGRPARAAAAAKPSKPIYIDSEDEDEMDVDDNDESALVEDASEDDFDESE